MLTLDACSQGTFQCCITGYAHRGSIPTLPSYHSFCFYPSFLPCPLIEYMSFPWGQCCTVLNSAPCKLLFLQLAHQHLQPLYMLHCWQSQKSEQCQLGLTTTSTVCFKAPLIASPPHLPHQPLQFWPHFPRMWPKCLSLTPLSSAKKASPLLCICCMLKVMMIVRCDRDDARARTPKVFGYKPEHYVLEIARICC